MKPKILNLEMHNWCNARCDFCSSPGLSKAVLPEGLFVCLLNQARELGIEGIVPFVKGEPFVFPERLFYWLDLIRLMGMHTVLYTNGALMTPKHSDRLVEYSDLLWYIVFSFPSLRPEAHRAITHMPTGALGKAFENFKYLQSLKPSFRVEAHMVCHPLNEAERESVERMPGFSYIPALCREGFCYPDIKGFPVIPEYPCPRVMEEITVHASGKAVICCEDAFSEVVLGDVKTDSLAAIWQRGEEIRSRQQNGDFSMGFCKTCKMNELDWAKIVKVKA